MAYTPITTSTTSSSDSNQGIPANTPKRYVQASIGISGVFTDYASHMAPEGDFLKIVDTSVLINSIRNLLLTPTGSYPFDPEYGSDLYKKVFDPADDQTAEEIKFEVVDKIRIYDHRVQISEVITEFFSNKKGFRLNISIQTQATISNLSLDITEDLGFSLEEGE